MLPRIFRHLHFCCREMTAVIRDLGVYPATCQRNLKRLWRRGVQSAGAAALVSQGMAREQASPIRSVGCP